MWSLGLLAWQGDPSLKSACLFVVECSFWLGEAKSDEVLFSDLARKENLVGSIGLLLRTVWNQWISCEPSCWSRFAVASYHMPWARLRTNGSFYEKMLTAVQLCLHRNQSVSELQGTVSLFSSFQMRLQTITQTHAQPVFRCNCYSKCSISQLAPFGLLSELVCGHFWTDRT